jgi:hypothetical protein
VSFGIGPVGRDIGCDSINLLFNMLYFIFQAGFDAVELLRQHLMTFGDQLEFMTEILMQDADVVFEILVELFTLPLQFIVYNISNHLLETVKILFFHKMTRLSS